MTVGVSKENKYPSNTSESTSNMESENISSILSEDNKVFEPIGKILEMNWCSYDMRKQIPSKEVQVFLKSDEFDLNSESLK